jgi:uncharacterized protein YbdZ (MbtH family)
MIFQFQFFIMFNVQKSYSIWFERIPMFYVKGQLHAADCQYPQ